MRARRLLAAGALVAVGLLTATVTASAQAPVATRQPAVTHQIGYDNYSLTIDGRRTFIFSGEFHPFRLPSPDEWTVRTPSRSR